MPCLLVLANNSVKPGGLAGHLTIKHPGHEDKPFQVFSVMFKVK